MALNVFYQVLNLTLLIALGFLLRRKLFANNFFTGLNQLVASVALPCLSFSKLLVPVDKALFSPLILLFFGGSLLILLSGLLAYGCFKKEPENRRSIFTHLTMFSNCAFIGFPIISAAFGEESLIYGVVYVAAFNILTWTVGVFLYGGKKALSIQKLFLNPTLGASLLGIVFFLFSWSLPSFPLNAISMIGDTTTPLSMLVIGAHLANVPLSSLKDRGLYLSSALRLVLIPLAFYLAFKWVPLPPMIFEIVFIVTAMPSAAVSVIQAHQFGADPSLAARGVALSTLCSIITIPLMMLLL